MGLPELVILATGAILELGLVVLVLVPQVLDSLVVDGGERVHKSVCEISYILVLLGGGISGFLRGRQQLPQGLLVNQGLLIGVSHHLRHVHQLLTHLLYHLHPLIGLQRFQARLD